MTRSSSIILIENRKKEWDDLGNKNKITFREKLIQEFPIIHQFLHVGFSPQTVQQCKNTNKAAYVALCLQQPAKKAEALLCSTLQSFGRGTNTQWHQRTEPTPGFTDLGEYQGPL